MLKRNGSVLTQLICFCVYEPCASFKAQLIFTVVRKLQPFHLLLPEKSEVQERFSASFGPACRSEM